MSVNPDSHGSGGTLVKTSAGIASHVPIEGPLGAQDPIPVIGRRLKAQRPLGLLAVWLLDDGRCGFGGVLW